eukprot:TRINITY_DN16304_c1_g2_i1.p1 TRINITY_DN16304_c1_g2~~TRINITY_DN16304_c1_g2_i1.p1  ORF type:complete len:236 (+),score=-11.70 TRINITY_DN16304_c1_g2_i1:701-1408(+)
MQLLKAKRSYKQIYQNKYKYRVENQIQKICHLEHNTYFHYILLSTKFKTTTTPNTKVTTKTIPIVPNFLNTIKNKLKQEYANMKVITHSHRPSQNEELSTQKTLLAQIHIQCKLKITNSLPYKQTIYYKCTLFVSFMLRAICMFVQKLNHVVQRYSANTKQQLQEKKIAKMCSKKSQRYKNEHQKELVLIKKNLLLQQNKKDVKYTFQYYKKYKRKQCNVKYQICFKDMVSKMIT